MDPNSACLVRRRGRAQPSWHTSRRRGHPLPWIVAGLLAIGVGVVGVVGTTPSPAALFPLVGVAPLLGLPILQKASAAYSVDHPEFVMSAMAVANSAQASQQLISGKADFMVTTIPLTPADRDNYPQYKGFPLLASAVVPIYNLPAAGGTAQLIMPMQVICDIERGVVTNWNDSRLQAANPKRVMPDLGITVLHLSVASSSVSDIITSMCGKIDPAFAAALPRSSSARWPTRSYFASGGDATADLIGSDVLDVKGAYSLVVLGNVFQLGVKYAAIQSVAGRVLQPTENAVSLNVIELAGQLGSMQANYDLTNPQTPGAWPICTMLSLTIDVTGAVTTCATKALLMDHLIWLYTSATVKELANTVFMAMVPDLFLSETGLLDTLRNTIQCAGQPLLSTATTTGFLQGFSAVGPLLTAYSSFYQSVEPDYQYDFESVTDSLATLRVSTNEIDLAVLNTRQLSQEDADLMHQDQGGIFLPAFYTGTVVTFTLPSMIVANYSKWNALTDTRGGLPQLLPLALDLETVAGIFTNQITSWTDPAILRTSPQLGPWFAAHPQASVAFQKIVCCSSPTDQQVAGILLLQSLNQTAIARSGDFVTYFDMPMAWPDEVTRPGSSFTLMDVESRLTAKSLVLQSRGMSTISYRLVSGSAYDPASEFRIVQTPPTTGVTETVNPQPSAFKACAYEGLRTRQLAEAGWTPPAIAGCYPLSTAVSFGVSLKYAGATCARGNRSLNFFSWLNSNSALSGAAQSSGVLRVSDIPEIQSYIATTLNTATCDGETLLITLPKVWQVSSAINGFGIAVMVIQLLLCVGSGVLLFVYRARPILRSSSVPFLGVSLVGLACLAISCAFWPATEVTKSSCETFMWCASLGFSIVFVPFFAKTWRVYMIFSRQKLKVVKISNHKLGLMVGLFLLVELILMIVWSQVSPLQPVTYLRNISGTMHQATHCSVDTGTHGMTFVLIEALYKGALLLIGSLLAFRTRKVNSSFNESSSIALAIYSVLFSSAILGGLIYFVSAFEDTLVLLMLFLLWWVMTSTWGLVFGTKFYQLFTQPEADPTMGSRMESIKSVRSGAGGEFSFLSMLTMPLPLLKSYVTSLELHLAKAKKHLAKVSGTALPEPSRAAVSVISKRHKSMKSVALAVGVTQPNQSQPQSRVGDGDFSDEEDGLTPMLGADDDAISEPTRIGDERDLIASLQPQPQHQRARSVSVSQSTVAAAVPSRPIVGVPAGGHARAHSVMSVTGVHVGIESLTARPPPHHRSTPSNGATVAAAAGLTSGTPAAAWSVGAGIGGATPVESSGGTSEPGVPAAVASVVHHHQRRPSALAIRRPSAGEPPAISPLASPVEASGESGLSPGPASPSVVSPLSPPSASLPVDRSPMKGALRPSNRTSPFPAAAEPEEATPAAGGLPTTALLLADSAPQQD